MNRIWTWTRGCLADFIPRGTAAAADYTTSSGLRPAPEETQPPLSDPYNEYPDIPTGQTIVSPIALKTFSSSCKIIPKDPATPNYFKEGADSLWSCNIPEKKPMMWDIDDWPAALAHTQTELSKLHSVPDTLTCEEWQDGKWGGYLMSSEEGEWSREQRNTVFETVTGERVRYAPSRGFCEGMQGPAFYRQPLAYHSVATTLPKRATTNATAAENSMSYTFGILYNKTVVLRETTMIQTHNTRGRSEAKAGNGLEFAIEEKVWMCVWEKTLLEVTVMVHQPSQAHELRTAAIDHGAGEDEDTSDDESEIAALTTILVGPSNAPSSSPSPTGPSPPPGPPPGPPPSEVDDGQPRLAKRGVKRGVNGPRHLSRKVYIKESRPSRQRLQRVLGFDLTDPDPKGLTNPGAVRCRKMIVQEDGGLLEFNGEGDEMVETTLVEKIDDYLSGHDTDADEDQIEAGDFPPDTGCICTWES